MRTDHSKNHMRSFQNKIGGEKHNVSEEFEEIIETKYRDIRHVGQKIYQSEGIYGFFKGSIPRMIYVAPGVAISWGTYEMFKAFLIEKS